jgi:hypothetical protein
VSFGGIDAPKQGLSSAPFTGPLLYFPKKQQPKQ